MTTLETILKIQQDAQWDGYWASHDFTYDTDDIVITIEPISDKFLVSISDDSTNETLVESLTDAEQLAQDIANEIDPEISVRIETAFHIPRTITTF